MRSSSRRAGSRKRTSFGTSSSMASCPPRLRLPKGKALRLPHDLDYVKLFHGVDERVPLDGLTFGVRVIGRLVLAG